MICAIHQPNFFPWLGYFDKIARADVFVFLDSVDYPKSGSSMSSWVNRVMLKVAGQKTWARCPVVREHGRQRICDVRIDAARPWQQEFRNLIDRGYRGSPGYATVADFASSHVNAAASLIAELNISAIEDLTKRFGLRCRFVRQSHINVEGKATELLVNLVRAVGADAYLCGGGAAGYQDDALFEAADVSLVYQNFEPRAYGDPARFIPGLSILDAILELGEAGVARLLEAR